MNAAEFASAKVEIRRRLNNLRQELDRYLAKEFGVRVEKQEEFEKWRASHQTIPLV